MTRRGIIAAEPPQQCDFCGEWRELRPYGPRREKVCHACALKDPAAMERGIRRVLLGEECQHGWHSAFRLNPECRAASCPACGEPA